MSTFEGSDLPRYTSQYTFCRHSTLEHFVTLKYTIKGCDALWIQSVVQQHLCLIARGSRKRVTSVKLESSTNHSTSPPPTNKTNICKQEWLTKCTFSIQENIFSFWVFFFCYLYCSYCFYCFFFTSIFYILLVTYYCCFKLMFSFFATTLLLWYGIFPHCGTS